MPRLTANHLVTRSRPHKSKQIKGFTSRYNLDQRVWFEEHMLAVDAIAREKQIKGWSRKKKIEQIETMEPKTPPPFQRMTRHSEESGIRSQNRQIY